MAHRNKSYEYFPFVFDDHPELKFILNRITILTFILAPLTTYLIGYAFMRGVLVGFMVYYLDINVYFRFRFDDLNVYDGYSGYYYVSGSIVYFFSCFIVFFSTLFAYFSNVKGFTNDYSDKMILGTAGFYGIAIFSSHTLIFRLIGISDEEYSGTSALFTAYFFPFLLGASVFFVQACTLSTVALLHRLRNKLRNI